MRGVPNLSRESFCAGKRDIADNTWTQVQIKRRNSTTLTLYINLEKCHINVAGFYSKRYAHQMFYLGGVGNSYVLSTHPRFRTSPFLRFEGCLENEYVKVNGLMLLDLARRGNATVHGEKIFRCNATPGGYSPFTFPTPDSFIKITAHNKNTAQYSFKFRTYNSKGILLFQRITKANGADIFISMDSGKIKVEVIFASKSSAVTLIGGSALDDGMWHHVAVNISIKNVRLEVDSELATKRQRSVVTFVSSSEVFVGASVEDKDRPGFIGCMRDLTVQGRKINFTAVAYKSFDTTSGCILDDLCVPNPCQNGGRCSQRWNQTLCHCLGTDFEGEKCETPSFFMQTCADWWAAGEKSNGYYKINPRNSETFLVYCNMTNVYGPSTVIFHAQYRKPIIAAQNKVGDKFYRHEISYENEQKIGDLIATSTYCRQYLEYNCYNSVLFDSPKSFNLESGRGARWVSRDGKTQDYWSGASRGSMKCACGMNGTCVESSKVCNCDTVNNAWHVDGGYLTDSRSLPVKTLKFSVDGTNVKSNYVLGNLECYGSVTNRTSTTNFPVSETLTTSPKSPSTKPTPTTSGKQTVTEQEETLTSTQPSKNIRSTTKTFSYSETRTQATVTPTNTSGLPGIVVIESPRKYITIRENANQELVLIILSVILAVFVIAIAILLIKQNLFFPCKCLQAPLYHDVRHMDTIELGPPSPMYGETEPEPILQFEASPYPARNFDIGMHECHISSSPELYSDAETDRLDISIGSSSWISENAEIDKDVSEKPIDYEDLDLGLIDVVTSFPAPKQLSTEQQIKKLKEVIFDVLSAPGDVRANYSDRKENHVGATNHGKNTRSTTQSDLATNIDQSQLAANGQLVYSDNNSTATISELDLDHELFDGDQCTRRNCGAQDDDTETEACDESSKESPLKTRETGGNKEINRGDWRSSDPHDNYLSLDVNHLEHDSLLRQPFGGVKLNGHGYNEQNSCDKDLRSPQKEKQLPAKCDGRNRELRTQKEDKCKYSSPRARLFSRQKSEEEALLSSTQASGLERTSRFSDTNQSRYSGISNVSCRQGHQRQSVPASKNQSENRFKDRNNVSAKVIPLKQSHSQKYETEL